MATSFSQYKDRFDLTPESVKQARKTTKKAPVKQKGRGGFLSSIISELGGAGGATGGAAAGAALGSVVPGIGTLVGGVLGGAIGGFGGGTIGRGIENKVRDDQNFFGAGGSAKAAFGEGALSGVLGGAGTAFTAARGLKAAGGMKGLKAMTAAEKATVNELVSKGIPVSFIDDTLRGGGTPQTLKKLLINPTTGELAQASDDLAKAGFKTTGRLGNFYSEGAASRGNTPFASITGKRTNIPLSQSGESTKGIINTADKYITKTTEIPSSLSLQDATKQIVMGGKKAGQRLATGRADDLFAASKATAGVNSLDRFGRTQLRNTLGIDDIKSPMKTGPTTMFKADELLDEAIKSGYKGKPVDVMRQINTNYVRLSDDVAKELAKSKGTTSVNKLYSDATEQITKKLPLRVDGVPVQDEMLRSLSQLTDVAKNGKLSASDISKFKQSLDVDSAFRKLSGDLTSPLTAKETVDLALWKQADDWITKLAPAAKDLTMRQSKQYGLAQGVARMTRTPGDPKTVMDLAGRIAGPGVRKAQNALGRGAIKVGAVEAGIPGRAGATKLGKSMLTRGIANNMFMPSAPQEAPEDQMPDMGTMTPDALYGASALGGQTMGGQEMPQQSAYSLEQAIADIAAAPNAKTQKAIMDYYDFVSKAEASQAKATGAGGPNITKVTGQQYVLANRGANAVQQLAQLIQNDPGVVNRLATPGRKLPMVGGTISKVAGTGDYDAISYNVANALLRLETGAQANPEEIKNLQTQLMPRAGDTAETIQIKLQQLQQAFDMFLQTANDAGSLSSQISDYQPTYGGM